MKFTEEQINDFSDILSRERIDHWKRLASSQNMIPWRARISCKIPPTDEYAILLHEWNSALSTAMMSSLQMFEISIRNHIHKSLSECFGTTEWWGQKTGDVWHPAKIIIGNQVNDIQRAIEVSARRKNKGITAGGVISELSFGFWLALLSQSYDNPSAKITLWRDSLYKVFSKAGKISRKDAHEELAKVVSLRNKCAHHEPIIGLDLNLEYLHMLRFTRRFSNTTAEWISGTSLVPDLLKPDWLAALGKAGRLIGLP